MDTKSLLFTLGIHFNPESQGQTESSGTVAQEERLFPIFLQTTYPGKNSSLAQQCPTGHESVLLLISHGICCKKKNPYNIESNYNGVIY